MVAFSTFGKENTLGLPGTMARTTTADTDVTTHEIPIHPWTIGANGKHPWHRRGALRRERAHFMPQLAPASLVTLGQIGMSWAIAGVAFCTFATVRYEASIDNRARAGPSAAQAATFKLGLQTST
jgi:hypothetical protein